MVLFCSLFLINSLFYKIVSPMVSIVAAISRHDRWLEDGGRSVDYVDLWIIGRGFMADDGFVLELRELVVAVKSGVGI
nr:hypothetical protein [Tanacetum cinerariifolium]